MRTSYIICRRYGMYIFKRRRYITVKLISIVKNSLNYKLSLTFIESNDVEDTYDTQDVEILMWSSSF